MSQSNPGPWILDQERAEEIVGHPLPEPLFRWAPLGHRIIVVVEPPAEKAGVLYIPDRSKHRPARGWVVSAGELVGTRWAPSGEATGWWPFSPPESILGARIIFGTYAGRAIKIDPTEDHKRTLEEWSRDHGVSYGAAMDDYLSPFKLLTDNDIWATEITPISTEPATHEETS